MPVAGGRQRRAVVAQPQRAFDRTALGVDLPDAYALQPVESGKQSIRQARVDLVRVQNFGQVAAHRLHRLHLARIFAHLLEQAGAVQRAGGLIGNCLQQQLIRMVERPGTPHHQHANQSILVKDAHRANFAQFEGQGETR